MKVIKDKTFPNERALYGERDIQLISCSFDGEEDGESALKESSNVQVDNCYFNLRYPFWHDNNVIMNNSVMTELCRAAFWYSNDITIKESVLGGIKALRECNKIYIIDSKISSPEFGWRSLNISLDNSSVVGEYPFFMSKDLHFNKLSLTGKYSFQYVENSIIENSYLDTKDAFWHTKNVTVRNSTIKGEYLAWYAENLTLDHCKIIGTQPLCYCKNLKLIDCEMEDADFSFEYSDVLATIKGNILSVKNPISGRIEADKIEEILLTEDSKYECNCEIISKRS